MAQTQLPLHLSLVIKWTIEAPVVEVNSHIWILICIMMRILSPQMRKISYMRESRLSVWMPNARHEPLPEAEAQRTLSTVGCKPLILIEASPSAYRGGMLALGKGYLAPEEETAGDCTPNRIRRIVASTSMPAACTSTVCPG
jgi:hypothetical protein